MRGFFYAGSAWEYYERRLGLRECRDVHCVFCGEDAREYRVHAENGLFGPDSWVTREERPVGHLGLYKDNQYNLLCVKCGKMLRDVPTGTRSTGTESDNLDSYRDSHHDILSRKLRVPGFWVATSATQEPNEEQR